MFFPAHINRDGMVQTVGQHSRNTAEMAKKRLKKLNLAHVAYLAGLLHDAGKCTDLFCRYVEAASRGEEVRRGSVIHTFAAVRFLLNTYHSAPVTETGRISDVTAEILSSAIGGHHGLFDCFDADQSCGFTHRIHKQPEYDDRAMKGFFAEVSDRGRINQLFSSAAGEISEKIQQIGSLSQCHEEPYFYLSLLTRLVTSALIDADRSDTAAFMNPDEYAEGNSAKQVTSSLRVVQFCCRPPRRGAWIEINPIARPPMDGGGRPPRRGAWMAMPSTVFRDRIGKSPPTRGRGGIPGRDPCRRPSCIAFLRETG